MLAHVMDVDDVGVDDPRFGQRLAPEACGCVKDSGQWSPPALSEPPATSASWSSSTAEFGSELFRPTIAQMIAELEIDPRLAG